MKSSDFFRKLLSGYLWLNLAAMAAVVVLLCLGVKYGIDLYTHHGEKIEVPDVKHKSFKDAEHLLEDRGLVVVVSDTGYVKTLPPDCVLEQSPDAGSIVKSGRIVYLIINSDSSPKLTSPSPTLSTTVRPARPAPSSSPWASKCSNPSMWPARKTGCMASSAAGAMW